MYKIGVIGDGDSVIGFMSVGFSVFPAENAADAAKIFKKIAREDFAVIYITEELFSAISEETEKYKETVSRGDTDTVGKGKDRRWHGQHKKERRTRCRRGYTFQGQII